MYTLNLSITRNPEYSDIYVLKGDIYKTRFTP